MKVSDNCINLIKQFEGFYSNAYVCPGGEVTIGYGSIMWKDGSKIKMGEKITEIDAIDLLKWEVENKAVAISKVAIDYKLNQNQFDAIVSFAYNCGVGAFLKSTLCRRIKENKNNPLIRDAFMMWTKADGKVLRGLVRRRTAEANLYFKA